MVSRKPPDQVKGEDFEKPARASSGRNLKGEKRSELPTQHQNESRAPQPLHHSHSSARLGQKMRPPPGRCEGAWRVQTDVQTRAYPSLYEGKRELKMTKTAEPTFLNYKISSCSGHI